MITKDYNNSIEKIENNIKVYDDFDKARAEFYRLKNLYYDDGHKYFFYMNGDTHNLSNYIQEQDFLFHYNMHNYQD